jgi:hypothetical protein
MKDIFKDHGSGRLTTRDLWVEVPNGKSSTSMILKDILHAPNMANTVISINWISLAR